MRGRNVLAVVAMVVIVVGGLYLAAVSGECGGMGGCIASARVDGRTYTAAVVRTFQIEPADLVRYATASRLNSGVTTIDLEAYRLGDIDPTRILVMKIAPGQSDDAGPLGQYLLLVGDTDAWSLTCPYVPSTDPLRPEVCASAQPSQGASGDPIPAYSWDLHNAA